MTDVTSDEKPAVDRCGAATGAAGCEQHELVQLAERARAEGLRLTGEGGLLAQLTKWWSSLRLTVSLTITSATASHDPAGRDGGNSRNGRRGKTVLTDAGPVDIEVPRDRDGTSIRGWCASGSGG